MAGRPAIKGTVVVLPDGMAVPPGVKTFRVSFGGAPVGAIHASDLKKFKDAGIRFRVTRTEVPGVLLGMVRGPRRRAKPQRKEDVRDAYMRLCGAGRKETLVLRARRTTGDRQLALSRARDALMEAAKQYEAAVVAQVGAEAAPENLEHVGVEFDQLQQHPDITKIEVGPDRLTIFTGPIDIVDGGHIYRVGRFRVEISEDGVVKMWNLSHRRGSPLAGNAKRWDYGGKQHPHVDGDGDPCLGNIRVALPQVVAERKYAAAASICIQFLKSYQAGHIGEIAEWPRLTKKDTK